MSTGYSRRQIRKFLNGVGYTEMAVIDGVTPGTATASKAVVLGASKEIATITTGTITNLTTTTLTLGATAVTSTAAELNKLDDSVTLLTRGAGVDTAETYACGYFRNGSLITTEILVDLSTLVGSATDLDIIGESAAASCHWGQITTALNGTMIGGKVTCLEVPAGGTADIDFYSSNVSTGTQDVIITDAALGTEVALVTSGGAWTSGATKGMTALPNANDYLYIVNGAASGGTFTAGKFLITLYGLGA